MLIKAINNPRKPDGNFGDVCCDVCRNYSSAYVELNTSVYHRAYETHRTVLCKGCLLDWVGLIDKTILNDVVEKGRRRRNYND